MNLSRFYFSWLAFCDCVRRNISQKVLIAFFIEKNIDFLHCEVYIRSGCPLGFPGSGKDDISRRVL